MFALEHQSCKPILGCCRFAAGAGVKFAAAEWHGTGSLDFVLVTIDCIRCLL